jgi:hypothetical protein
MKFIDRYRCAVSQTAVLSEDERGQIPIRPNSFIMLSMHACVSLHCVFLRWHSGITGIIVSGSTISWSFSGFLRRIAGANGCKYDY